MKIPEVQLYLQIFFTFVISNLANVVVVVVAADVVVVVVIVIVVAVIVVVVIVVVICSKRYKQICKATTCH